MPQKAESFFFKAKSTVCYTEWNLIFGGLIAKFVIL